MSKVSGSDGLKSCHVECEGTEGFRQVCALACRTLEPHCECRCSARDSLHLRCGLSGAGEGLCRFLSIRQPQYRWGLADVVVKSFKFRLVVVYAPNTAVKRVSFFRWLAPFLNDSKRLVLMGDWNAILDPKIDKIGPGASRLGRCESSLIDLMACNDLVDRFRLDHPARKMWMWLDSSTSAKVGSYLDRVSIRRADCDFVSCPTFHLVGRTDHKLVRVSLRLANRPSLAGYWKFNTTLLEIRNFRDLLESQIRRALVGAVTGNRWRVSVKHRIKRLRHQIRLTAQFR